MHKYTPPPIDVGQSTDVGRRRHENQDSMGYVQLDRFAYKGAHLLICTDGMGGASGGQQASSTAVEKILAYFQEGHPSPEPDIAIREAVESAAEAVQEKAQEDPRLEGMGTTCVVVLVHNGYLFAGHIGDSRLYLLRQGKLKRMSRDHSRVQFMVEAGIISEEDAKRHPHQNFLARVLGSNQQPRVELLAPPCKLRLGDRLLLCSDGLYNEVSDDKIAETLDGLEPQEAADKLVQIANDNGGNDNITVQILSYGPPQPVRLQESWFSFSSASVGLLFYFVGAVLFFLAGFYSGRKSGPAHSSTHIGASVGLRTTQGPTTTTDAAASDQPVARQIPILPLGTPKQGTHSPLAVDPGAALLPDASPPADDSQPSTNDKPPTAHRPLPTSVPVARRSQPQPEPRRAQPEPRRAQPAPSQPLAPRPIPTTRQPVHQAAPSTRPTTQPAPTSAPSR